MAAVAPASGIVAAMLTAAAIVALPALAPAPGMRGESMMTRAAVFLHRRAVMPFAAPMMGLGTPAAPPALPARLGSLPPAMIPTPPARSSLSRCFRDRLHRECSSPPRPFASSRSARAGGVTKANAAPIARHAAKVVLLEMSDMVFLLWL